MTNGDEKDVIELLASMGVRSVSNPMQENTPIRLGRAKALGFGRMVVINVSISEDSLFSKSSIDPTEYIKKGGVIFLTEKEGGLWMLSDSLLKEYG